MVGYEVRVTVEADSCTRFESYMRERHIPEVLSTGAFSGATFETLGPGSYRTRYVAPDRDSLDRYLTVHAARLRGDFAAHFPTGVSVAREEWNLIETFA